MSQESRKQCVWFELQKLSPSRPAARWKYNLFGTNVCKQMFVRAWACGNGLVSKLQEAVLEGAPGPPGDARRKPSFPKTNLVPCTDVVQFFYWCWSSVAQHLPDAPVDRDDDDEAGCVAGDSPLSLVGWGSGAESVTVSGPPRLMPHINRQEWYEQYLLHRAARKGHPVPASKRTFVRVYMRHWKNT